MRLLQPGPGQQVGGGDGGDISPYQLEKSGPAIFGGYQRTHRLEVLLHGLAGASRVRPDRRPPHARSWRSRRLPATVASPASATSGRIVPATPPRYGTRRPSGHRPQRRPWRSCGRRRGSHRRRSWSCRTSRSSCPHLASLSNSGRRDRLQLLLRCLPRPAEKQEGQGEAGSAASRRTRVRRRTESCAGRGPQLVRSRCLGVTPKTALYRARRQPEQLLCSSLRAITRLKFQISTGGRGARQRNRTRN
jgi:hypothetical protein